MAQTQVFRSVRSIQSALWMIRSFFYLLVPHYQSLPQYQLSSASPATGLHTIQAAVYVDKYPSFFLKNKLGFNTKKGDIQVNFEDLKTRFCRENGVIQV